MRRETALKGGARQIGVKTKAYKNVDITKVGKATAMKLLIYAFGPFLINIKQILWQLIRFERRSFK